MAAPTVGAVMADILPYLGVQQHFSEGELAGKTIVMPDLVGLTAAETEKVLKEQGLTMIQRGSEETVTGQIPAAGQEIPGGSQVIVYFGEDLEAPMVEVPDFLGMDRQQASDAAGKLGLYILVSGNPSLEKDVKVTNQEIPAGTKVPAGTTVKLNFTDTAARD